MTAWYNEIDPNAAQWLRNLIAAGHIASGDVDERSIVDVRPGDLRGYTQCHFFAGIGGWSYALRLAGWPDDRSVWTGSCPCQPFSAAGKGKAADDERHLWPAWFSLIRECRPAIIFGEQVEAAIGWGWLDAVFADLEAEGYACGAAVLPACSIGAPHIRQRLWFVGQVADAISQRYACEEGASRTPRWGTTEFGLGGESSLLADARLPGSWRNARAVPGSQGTSESERGGARDIAHEPVADGATGDWPRGSYGDESGHATGCKGDCGRHAICCGGSCCANPDECDGNLCWLANAGHDDRAAWLARREQQSAASIGPRAGSDSEDCGLADADGQHGRLPERPARREDLDPAGRCQDGELDDPTIAGSPWAEAEWIACRDGKSRPVEPGTSPLAHGIPGRVGRLRAYGNAIVPQVAAEFIRASQEF